MVEELHCCGYTMFREQIRTKPKLRFDTIGATGWQCGVERAVGWGRHDKFEDEEGQHSRKLERIHVSDRSSIKPCFAKSIERGRLLYTPRRLPSPSKENARQDQGLYMSHRGCRDGHISTRMYSDCEGIPHVLLDNLPSLIATRKQSKGRN